ncbi:hypothetical protein [uncultured Eubacterium sp.]|uniref:hypothetical protein n=1 Tax=uncultured Eubacterium sp. TaxID=165185 RepID=UPI003267E25B
MVIKNKKGKEYITCEMIFIIAYSIMLINRIYVISGVHEFKLNPTLIQVGYIAVLVFVEFWRNSKLVLKCKINDASIIIFLLSIYAIAFGYIFINPIMKLYTESFAQRQLLFLGVIISTLFFVRKYNLIDILIRTNYYSLILVLLIQFFLNIKDIYNINILAIFNLNERSRVNFGLGHYNYLGTICAATIIMGILMLNTCKMQKREKRIMYLIAIPVLIMLLGSASRNAIIGILIFIIVEIYIKINEVVHIKKDRFIIKFILATIVGVLLLLNFGGGKYEDALMYSNRYTIFYNAIPAFFRSGRTLIGLGLASPEVYGQNLTQYKTYWLDNGYAYTLITTGYIGMIIYGIVILLIFKNLKKASNISITGKIIFGIYVMYLFGSLFEATLFNGGVLQNYIYIPIFLLYCSKKNYRKV